MRSGSNKQWVRIAGNIEAHQAAAPFTSFTNHAGTSGLGDLVFIKLRGTGSGVIELFAAGAVSGYQQLSRVRAGRCQQRTFTLTRKLAIPIGYSRLTRTGCCRGGWRYP
ncbi:hypothetical protein Rhe02_03840 [Rhizocola hellebori]|uniref:Uncharacterized protein n=1 Tax=Rhizocola hellebori TaxID=1392758 RepID=A0A8J3Q2T2_9ACTN|nr:hypothetical protein Rhe02_03840 [Rhizocola hellebori]